MADESKDESMRCSNLDDSEEEEEVVGEEEMLRSPPPEEARAGGAGGVVQAHNTSCTLGSLQLAVSAGFQSSFFMGPLGGKGLPPWHEWRKQHLVALLGSVGYNLRRSDASNNTTTWTKFKRIVKEKFGVTWKRRFVEPDHASKTAWLLSIVDGARRLDRRWNEVCWIFFDWSMSQLQVIGTPMAKYWFMPYLMLNNPLMRVHAKFVAALGDKLLLWADGWLRGEGGRFLEARDGEKQLRRLPPAMRFAEVAEFSVEFLRRLEVLRAHPEVHFGELLAFARETLGKEEMEGFMQNFTSDDGFFKATAGVWREKMDRYQHLPLSMARIACSSFRVDEWAGSEKASERAVGQEFAMAFLAVLWPEEHAQQQRPSARTRSEGEVRDILEKDLEGVTSTEKKDELTFGLYSMINDDPEFRAEVARYAASACGERGLLPGDHMEKEEEEGGEKEEGGGGAMEEEKEGEVGEKDVEEGGGREAAQGGRGAGQAGPGVVGVSATAAVSSRFAPISDFPRLYREACHKIYIVPIHMQLMGTFMAAMFAAVQARESGKDGDGDDNEEEGGEEEEEDYEEGEEEDYDEEEDEEEDDDDDDDDDDLLDMVRIGQFRSAESRHITRKGATPKEILEAGKKAMAEARALKNQQKQQRRQQQQT